jgi:predicted transcriptional regulator
MLKLTNKEEEIMHILWKLKSVRKELMLKSQRSNRITTPCRPSCVTLRKNTLHNAYGKTHQYYPIIAIEDYRKGFMNMAIDNYFNSSYKTLCFCQRRENISQRASRNFAMIENKKEENSLSPRNNNCVFKN